ncbi:hypothetical protein D3C86_2053040 [compost metagenome]
MQHHQGTFGLHLAQRVFQPHRFLDAFCHHRLDRRFAEGAEHVTAETAGKAFDTSKTDAVDLDR